MMIEFKQWVALKATPLLIVPWATLVVLLSTAQATVVKDLRTGDNQGFVRLVMEFDRPLTPHPVFSVDRNSLKITLTGIDNLPATPAAIDGITRLEVFRQPDGTSIEMDFTFAPAEIKTFILTGPHRFIIDAYRPLPAGTLPSTAKGDIRTAAMKQNQTKTQAHPESYTLPAADSARSGIERQNRFRQRLVAALIGVTSIIAMLLFFLIRTASARSGNGRKAWIDQLPSTRDPDIETIDSAIRNHLKTYDRL